MRKSTMIASALLLASFGLTAHAAPPPATAAEVAEFKALEVKLWEAWNKRLNPADAAPFYSKDPKNIHFDFSPMKFTGWAEYERIASANLGGMGGGHAVTKINDDFTVIKSGELVVAAFTFHVDFYGKDGKPIGMDARETDVWSKENGKWVIVHQHMSFPSGGEAPAAAPAAAAAKK